MSPKDWHDSTAVARAFSIGKAESTAVSRLLTSVHKAVLEKLIASVKKRGMQRLLLHDAIARDIFSEGFTSGQGTMEAWKDNLTNLKANLTLLLVSPLFVKYLTPMVM